ncbi:hypothetical protein GCM10007276_10710 [Agaricicola taiwanensis]|uniref:Uncharacterized protein n=1 Tax=Agaricicola taiwanensis TaxID=591372 RepID=A0A8J2VPY1_9RHOB|nr:hypothetical protein [Agaricicola taiwanensis]GGE35071.1 hypothetical protein GCM10007276_10710 [Agaricicola taiwanensis]
MTYPAFTLDGYAETIRGLTDRGYRVTGFQDAVPTERHLILRHDIDQSIPRARRMAEREAAEGWCATYFVLLRTEMYNPWSRQATEDLRAMRQLGHEIGLHLDASCYADAEAMEHGAEAECRALENIIEAPVSLISFHRPAKSLLGGDRRIAGRLHTYMDRFTRDMGYSSDSRGAWRHGHPWQHEAVLQSRALQLLTHSVWWVGSEPQEPHQRLADVLDEHVERLDRDLAINNDVWSGRST